MALCRRRRDACHLVKQRNTSCLSLQQSRPFRAALFCVTNKATSCVFASKITATMFIRTVGKYCVICGVDNRPQAVRVRLLLLPELHGDSTQQKPSCLRRHCARKFVPFAKYAYVVAAKQGKRYARNAYPERLRQTSGRRLNFGIDKGKNFVHNIKNKGGTS